jgi:hypothetical protein
MRRLDDEDGQWWFDDGFKSSSTATRTYMHDMQLAAA